MSIDPDVICAPATPEGTSALAVIRMSGRGSFRILEKLMDLHDGRMRGMRRKVGPVYEGDRVLDEVVALSWPPDRSYTGEEMVEITCHGVPSIVRGIIDSLVKNGARRAEAGEFTRRAYLSGRLSALDVMALAGTWDGGRSSGELSGKVRREVGKLREMIVRAQEVLEGDIEFGERYPDAGGSPPQAVMEELLKASAELGATAAGLEGRIRVLLMGPVNSGKSTLFNRIVGREKALVSDIPGTTRDGASAEVEIRGRKLLLCDTAGVDGVGMDGVASRRVQQEISSWDRVIWLSSREYADPPEELTAAAMETVRVASKSDAVSRPEKKGWIRVSSVTGEGLERLKEMISGISGSASLEGIMERVMALLRKSRSHLVAGEYDMAAALLSEAEQEAELILGDGEGFSLSVERALSRMCVGK